MKGTAHNAAAPGEIAKTVLMPGDPLRAQFIAETYLENPVCFNKIRGMLGYTGTYRGKPVSIMGSGMGMPSMGIYSYELYHTYDVDSIIRIGSAGAVAEGVALRDLVFAMGASTDSNYGRQFGLPGAFAPIADFSLLRKAVTAAEEKGFPHAVGNVFSSDVFYQEDPAFNKLLKELGILAVEMESAALYMNAAHAGKKALCILTVSDLLETGEALPPEERQIGFRQMMEVALELI